MYLFILNRGFFSNCCRRSGSWNIFGKNLENFIKQEFPGKNNYLALIRTLTLSIRKQSCSDGGDQGFFVL